MDAQDVGFMVLAVVLISILVACIGVLGLAVHFMFWAWNWLGAL